MEVTLDELRSLRQLLTIHRLEHERMVTKMQVLRNRCRKVRLSVMQSQFERRNGSIESSLRDAG